MEADKGYYGESQFRGTGMLSSDKGDLRAKAARRALTARFRKLGLEYASLDPVIRTTMEQAAISSGSVAEQIDGFVRVAEVTERFDIAENLKREMVVKA